MHNSNIPGGKYYERAFMTEKNDILTPPFNGISGQLYTSQVYQKRKQLLIIPDSITHATYAFIL